MKQILWVLAILSVLFVVSCQPVAQPAAPAPSAPAVPEAQPSAAETAQAESAEVPPEQLENAPAPVETGIDLGKVCFELLSADEFKSICSNDSNIAITPKITKGNCWVPIVDQANTRFTAGFEVINMQTVKDANRDFDRGVTMRKTQGAVEGKEVGDRSYQYTEIGRQNLIWTRGEFITHVGVMNALCPPEKIVELAQKINSRLQ